MVHLEREFRLELEIEPLQLTGMDQLDGVTSVQEYWPLEVVEMRLVTAAVVLKVDEIDKKEKKLDSDEDDDSASIEPIEEEDKELPNVYEDNHLYMAVITAACITVQDSN